MQRHSQKLNKKGFTLVELCVVMAVIAIIGGMITTFLMMFKGNTTILETEYTMVGDVGTVQQIVDQFVHHYDNMNCDFAVNGDGLIVHPVTIDNNAESEDLAYKTSPTVMAQLSFANGVMVWSENGSTKNIYQLKTITRVGFVVNNEIIQTNVAFGADKSQILLFPIFSHVSRLRYASNERRTEQ